MFRFLLTGLLAACALTSFSFPATAADDGGAPSIPTITIIRQAPVVASLPAQTVPVAPTTPALPAVTQNPSRPDIPDSTMALNAAALNAVAPAAGGPQAVAPMAAPSPARAPAVPAVQAFATLRPGNAFDRAMGLLDNPGKSSAPIDSPR